MSDFVIEVTTQRDHYRVEVYVDGEVQPRTIFGCRDALKPILDCLESTARQEGVGWTRPETDTRHNVPEIAFLLPTGRSLTYVLARTQQPLSSGPQLVP
jgi:hypothetical protein